MKKLFEILKLLFFFFAVFLGLFFLRGPYLWKNCSDDGNTTLCLMSEKTFNLIREILMPGFLILCGIMIGYVIATIWIIKSDTQNNSSSTKIYTKSFMIGLIIGIGLSLVYTFS